MLFPAPFLEPMRWTGEAKAFAFYVTSECLPQERLATVYVARKLFEDGSTITVVRNVPCDRLPRLKSATTAEGRIERDPNGVVTRLETMTVLRPHGGSSFYSGPTPDGGWETSASIQAPQPYPITMIQAALELNPKTGLLEGLWKTTAANVPLKLTQVRSYWLDPLEAIAFGSPADLAAGWLLPTGFVPPDRQGQTIGVRIVPVPKVPFVLDLDGKHEMFRRIDLQYTRPDSPRLSPAAFPGTLLFHQDGRLAAYAPGAASGETPGAVMGSGTYGKSTRDPLPPVELKGKAKEMWDKYSKNRVDETGRWNLFVPTPVGPDERRILMDAIGERARPEPPATTPDEPPAR